jgi:RNA polymerase sigma-70 factor, ECF subfamily
MAFMLNSHSMTDNIEFLYTAFSTKLKSFILSKVKDQALADDLLQEVFIKVHTRIDTLNDSEKVQGWIFQIARNLILDHFKKTKKEIPFTDQVELTAEVVEDNEMAEALKDMVKMMDTMPAEYCEALCMADLGGMNLQAYADQAGISYTLAKTRVFRARKMLKDMLMKCCHYQFDIYGTVTAIHPTGCCSCNEHNSCN